jgi:hypothetical protein
MRSFDPFEQNSSVTEISRNQGNASLRGQGFVAVQHAVCGKHADQQPRWVIGIVLGQARIVRHGVSFSRMLCA